MKLRSTTTTTRLTIEFKFQYWKAVGTLLTEKRTEIVLEYLGTNLLMCPKSTIKKFYYDCPKACCINMYREIYFLSYKINLAIA